MIDYNLTYRQKEYLRNGLERLRKKKRFAAENRALRTPPDNSHSSKDWIRRVYAGN